MGMTDSDEILIRVDSVEQLFNGSTINPFSDKPAVILGEAALLQAIQLELGHGLRAWRGKHLVVQLPAGQISPETQSQVSKAIQNYAQSKISQNNFMIRSSRVRSLISLCLAIIIAAALLAILTIVTGTVLASSSDTVKGVFAGLVTIFIWSTVWNPWDRLVYEWLEPWRENRILRNLLNMEIHIRPE
jgi:hypothetical protein